MTNFADYPVSISEARADAAGAGALWSPRDALISALRQLDAGEIDPEMLAIVYRNRVPEAPDGGVDGAHIICAGRDKHAFLGLMAAAAFELY